MVKEVRVVDTVDPVQAAKGVFFGGILVACILLALVLMLAGVHAGLSLVIAFGLLAVFTFACRRFPTLIWIVGVIQTVMIGAGLYYAVSNYTDWIWGAIAGVAGAAVMLAATRTVARVL